VCIVGKMAQDVGMVQSVIPTRFGWFFEGSIPTCACLHLENFFVTCSCFLCFFIRNEEVGGKAKGKMHWSL